ncbi:hypothetical protein SYK_24790 [Pseudodesulfovibrio nedwellii]|uniref:Uncharacterized protein n=1 Tax=Pseudodesulfovibrio nedwellii TaxID=2973072 RepID=A0ABM8B2X0_9BACT|nr:MULTISPECIES: hypothetical protein [Pseudodesulfovibrio]BDQ38119.1 hypothetical protein SYK_24790 [Pseudodesulfovibrio nedwellii]
MDKNTQNESVTEIFLLGLKTWVAEMKWLIRSQLSRFEVRRLEKELDREYGMLGRIAEEPRGKKAEKELCLKQIAFLKEEIATLKSELAGDREERMKDLHDNNQG